MKVVCDWLDKPRPRWRQGLYVTLTFIFGYSLVFLLFVVITVAIGFIVNLVTNTETKWDPIGIINTSINGIFIIMSLIASIVVIGLLILIVGTMVGEIYECYRNCSCSRLQGYCCEIVNNESLRTEPEVTSSIDPLLLESSIDTEKEQSV